MITIPSGLSGLDKRQLQDLAQAATEQLFPSCNGDFIRANRLCRAQNPALFAAIDKNLSPPTEQPPIISQAARQSIVQPDQVIDTLGLCGSPTLGETTACWRAMGNRADGAKAPEAFESLVHLEANNRNISYVAAKSAVSIRHPVLKVKADAALAARKIGATLPPSSLENDMSQAAVRQTYADALRKHMAENPDDGPIKSHRAVMQAHPALATAMKGNNSSQIDPNDDAVTATANESTVLANEADMPLATTKPFLSVTDSRGHVVAFGPAS